MHNRPKVRNLLFASIFVLAAGSVVFAGRICDRYPNSQKTTNFWGETYCGGWGPGCTECYNPDTGAACHTPDDTCEPGNDLDNRY